ncbi:glycosyltransferase [Terracidiphilus sp.]|jgi:ceramide glucosyltransferase|uniref:glycosyltransferase n=1 Tax=Terracidiphilus sp. TaxID=1964191 RepID=UPI003C22E1B8
MLYVLLALAIFGLFTSTVFTGMVLTALPSYLRERRAALEKLASGAGFMPPLSLLKPLHGAEPGLEGYLETFFAQDYPRYEILFCARSAEDAGLAVARRVAARHPEVPVKFLATGGEPDYINAKAASLEHMEAAAEHEILVISDSDVRVTPDYLRSVALPFTDPRVGGITCLYRGVVAEGGLWARVEAVGMSVEMTAGVLVARNLEGMQFTLGPTMAFRRETIRRMGGFAVTADYCADDFVLGNEAYKQGDAIVLSHHAIDHIVINASFWQSMLHQVRWMKSTRFSRPKGHFGTALTFAMPFGLLGLAAGGALGHWEWGIALLAWAMASRLAISIPVGRMVVQDRSWLALLLLYPVRDLMGFFFWAASYTSSRIHWRGRIYRLLPGGKMRAAE